MSANAVANVSTDTPPTQDQLYYLQRLLYAAVFSCTDQPDVFSLPHEMKGVPF